MRGDVAEQRGRRRLHTAVLVDATLNYTERDLGGKVAALMLTDGKDWIAVVFDPRVVRPAQMGLLRYWAWRQAAAGWEFAALPADALLRMAV